MKQPFRFFRGEFNGYYIYRLATFLNHTIKEIVDELVYHRLMQWKLEDEVVAGELPMRDEDILNIGKIAGLFLPRTYGKSTLGSVYFMPSHIVYEKQRSERGLSVRETGTVRFVREEHDEYDDDIVTEATPDFRATFIPEGTEPVGYVKAGTDLYTINGDVIWENVLPDPPTDGTPYVPFYGERFTIHEEYYTRDSFIPIQIYKLLFECSMRIRYDGPSIETFMFITRVLGKGAIYNIEIIPMSRYYLVYYTVDELSTIPSIDRLVTLWLDICQKRFKLFKLTARL